MIIEKEILEKMYLTNKMSQKKIANYFGCCQQTISRKMKKYNISKRSCSEAMICFRHGTEEQKSLTYSEKEFIMGEIYGDGCLNCNTSGGLPIYRHSSKYKEYLIWLKEMLPSLNWCSMNESERKNGKTYYSLNSYVHKDLKIIYNKFYIDGKKIIPKDTLITPLILRQWYLGDGCCSWGKSRSKGIQRKRKRNPNITISVGGFSYKDLVEIISPELEKVNILVTIVKKDTPGMMIRVRSESIERFFNYIGECPIDCYSYKWLSTEEKLLEYENRKKDI